MNRKILVVDDSRSIRMMVSKKLQNEFGLVVDTAEDLASAKQLLDQFGKEYLVAIVDLNLPDAPDGELIDLVSERGICSVVLTGTFDERIRKKLFSKNIIDYLLKEGGRDLDLIVQTIARLQANELLKVLVVDDSRFSRNYISKLLMRQHFQVLEAENGVLALEMLEAHPDICLVLTDYNMPSMDGFELTARLRQSHGKDSLAIIGISAAEDDYCTAKFLKLGANDFLKKPFGTEEFYCRLSQNLDLLDMIRKIKEVSNTDFLTKLHNRRYFFDQGARHLSRANHLHNPIGLAMIDIDFFKKINDTYGHDGGDLVLCKVAKILRDSIRPTDMVARFGGEEFCILLDNIDRENAVQKMESIRQQIEQTPFAFDNQILRCTISVGLTLVADEHLANLVRTADQFLYQAKHAGRNQLIHD